MLRIREIDDDNPDYLFGANLRTVRLTPIESKL